MIKLLLAATALVGLAGTAHAQAVSESGDAGETLATAQAITGGVSSISGTLSNLGGNTDDVDLFSLFISDTDAFSVTASASLSADNDAQLFLFDSAGQLVLSNDDGGVGLLPLFAAGSLSGAAAGTYYLAFNLYDTDPILDGGVLTGWTRDPSPFQTGPYTLDITGAGGNAVPEPASWAMMIAGFGLLGTASRRVRQTVAIA